VLRRALAITALDEHGAHTRRGAAIDIPPAVDDIEMFSWINELHHIGTRYMRSLDAMDGI